MRLYGISKVNELNTNVIGFFFLNIYIMYIYVYVRVYGNMTRINLLANTRRKKFQVSLFNNYIYSRSI